MEAAAPMSNRRKPKVREPGVYYDGLELLAEETGLTMAEIRLAVADLTRRGLIRPRPDGTYEILPDR